MKGDGNQQDYGMRIYDPRLGKFLSVDALSSKFPYYSSYQFAGNRPINSIDLDGNEDQLVIVNRWTNASVISTVYKGDGNFETTKLATCKAMGINVNILPKSGTFTMQSEYTSGGNKPDNIRFAYTPTTEVFEYKDNTLIRGLHAMERVQQSMQGSTYGEGEDWVKGGGFGTEMKLSVSSYSLSLKAETYSTGENNIGFYASLSLNVTGDAGGNTDDPKLSSSILDFTPKLDTKVYMYANTQSNQPSQGVRNETYSTGQLQLGPLRLESDSKGVIKAGWGANTGSTSAKGTIINKTTLFDVKTGTTDISGGGY